LISFHLIAIIIRSGFSDLCIVFAGLGVVRLCAVGTPLHREVVQSVNGARTLYGRWQELLDTTNTAEDEEFKWTTHELKRVLKSIDWDLLDLDETINILYFPFFPPHDTHHAPHHTTRHAPYTRHASIVVRAVKWP
jgi:hypothetical protein